jgi:hypothetical protein
MLKIIDLREVEYENVPQLFPISAEMRRLKRHAKELAGEYG